MAMLVVYIQYDNIRCSLTGEWDMTIDSMCSIHQLFDSTIHGLGGASLERDLSAGGGAYWLDTKI